MKAIAAISNNLIIGNQGSLPWKSSEDLAHFKAITTNQCLLMGRKTYQSCPPLKNRITYVLTKGEKSFWIDNLLVFKIFSIKEIPKPESVFLCGGAELYKQFLPECSEFFLTIFDFPAFGDTKFPYSLKEIQKMFPKVELHKSITNGSIYRYSK